jgi:hypothetical protein
VRVKLYVEGGGRGQLGDSLFREGWRRFFEAAGLGHRMPRVVRGQGRNQTYQDFATAVLNARPGELPLLLVDSEDPVDAAHSAWQHLKARDNWSQPTGAVGVSAFLMVQVMETWLLADRTMLKEHFHQGFRETGIPKWPNLEAVPKPDVLSALAAATAGCRQSYAKGRVSFELLGKVSPGAVEAACPSARALLDYLRTC